MEIKIQWYKRWYESQFQLFSDDQEIGEISPVAFSSKTIACMNGKKYIFKPGAFLFRKITILDSDTMTPVGKINFVGIGVQGVISLGPKDTFQLRCNNILTTRWTISYNRKEVISYNGNFMEGLIKADFHNPVLILAGLYASIFQWRKAGFLIIILVPIILILIRTL